MLAILESLKTIIERFIVNIVPLTLQADPGDTVVTVASTRRCCIGDQIVVYNKPDLATQAIGEVHTIACILDSNNIQLDTALQITCPVGTSYIEKLIGYTGGEPRFLEAVYLGDPAVIPRYPAITIDGKSRNSKWITLESTQEDYEIDIAVYIDAADYEVQYRLMYAWVSQIEKSLFRSFYPLVSPYNLGVLAANVNADDSTIQLVDANMECHALGWIFLESYDYCIPNRIEKYLGNNVYQLVRKVGFDFSAGDKVIKPTRHIFDTLPASTRYGFINKGGGMLKASIISYRASEEVKRLHPYIDSLTF